MEIINKIQNMPNGSYTHEGFKNFSKKTIDNMIDAIEHGYKIIIGNNPEFPTRLKNKKLSVYCIAHTNSRHHGKSIRTIFAVK